ncbi:RNA polymerase subunit sigma [Pullulanibacillus camelliae]|uniref:RNA polymerase sigma factor n=1 Tax=Pullulanibacillus camelliae TaxID=1707096 RepID=A0A8J2YGT0_9BACL|nr:sigma-70 family RNA polymerase sigma factor [Pullulanibacillus camelliae]GGE37905.1 RNA polymerase subunit sigma [Pullulanibacillus camelliae]
MENIKNDEEKACVDYELLLEELMDEYGTQVKKLAYTYVRHWSIAEDVAQEVFLSVYKNLHRFRGEASYKTWIYKITINKSKDALKSRFFRPEKLLQKLKTFSGQEAPSAEDHVIIKNEDGMLSECVMALPVKYREVIILYYYENLKLEEIQDYTKLKLSTIKTRLRRAKGLLRSIYEEKGGVDNG